MTRKMRIKRDKPHRGRIAADAGLGIPPVNPSVADIRALLQAERKQREEACLKELQAVMQPILKKYNCESTIKSLWVVVALDPQ